MVGTQTNKSGVSRRKVLKTGTAAVALVMAPTVLRAQGRAIKIGLVTPATGPLAIFAEPDAFVIAEFKKAINAGIKIGNQTHAVEHHRQGQSVQSQPRRRSCERVDPLQQG